MARPVSAMPGDVKRKVTGMVNAVERDRRAIVRSGAETAAERQRRVMQQDSGGDMQLSGVGRRRGRAGNARIGVRVRNLGDLAEVTATGPLPLIDRDVPGHVIRSSYVRGAYRSSRAGGQRTGQIFGPAAPTIRGDRRAVLNIPGVGFRRSARHPGTRGKDTWSRGLRVGLPAADVEIAKETTIRFTRAFRS